ncbi:hypothetical protein SB5439_05125 [Klebsiella variicola]|uniref:VapE domain-containing protein n=1 Tax=Klebsiella variicola TaxID=244366 RepID=UPI00109CB367|nr:VapE domain-containing protein [Klebsiella variicola]VGQ12999.1 hypothetical protein SB5439_05125 [Klebsiella variicola]
MWDFFAAEFGAANLVPIAQPGEDTISELAAGVVGKVPSIYSGKNKIVGFKDWQTQRVTAANVEKWKNDPRYGFGILLGRPLPLKCGEGVAVCIDVDTENADYQRKIALLIMQSLHREGIARRVRDNSNRAAYVIRIITDQPIHKRVLKLAPNADSGKKEAIEFLGLGQQFVAWGVHPSGAKIEWLNDFADSLVAVETVPDLNQDALTLDAFNQLIDNIAQVLPIISDKTKRARRDGTGNPSDVPDDDVATYLDANGWTLSIGSEGERHIRSPFAAEYSNEQEDGDTSVTYFLPGTHGFEQGHFVSLHASDADRNNGDFLEAIGIIADEFETLPALYEPEPGETVYRGISGKGCILDAKGRYGDNYIDKARAAISQALQLPLMLIPPRVIARRNSKGEIIGFTALNHSENLRFAIERQRRMLMLNEMTYAIELLNADGSNATYSDAQTSSEIVNSLAECSIPLETEKKHFDALAGVNRYHPVARLLHGREWDGVKRVDEVLACVNAKDPVFAAAVLRKTLIAAIAALEEGRVAMKSVPVIFSKANSWFKSAFIKRIFDIIPGAFAEGLSVDPRSKDSLRPAILVWGAELGELDAMSKVESGLLKAWIPAESDQWRTEHKAFFTRKPRQTVYLGTVNKDDFIKDETLASRFPIIELAGPINIDRVNQLLGWRHTGKTAQLVNPEKLLQFWLEVREEFRAGAGYVLDADIQAQSLAISDQFTDKGSYYEILCSKLETAADDREKWPYLRVPDICRVIGVSIEKSSPVGKALKLLLAEGKTDAKKPKNVVQYRFPVADSLTAEEFI